MAKKESFDRTMQVWTVVINLKVATLRQIQNEFVGLGFEVNRTTLLSDLKTLERHLLVASMESAGSKLYAATMKPTVVESSTQPVE